MLDVKRFWMWENATEGMQVYLINNNAKNYEYISGVVSEVHRVGKFRTIDGKLVNVTRVAWVTIKCANGKEITVKKSNPQYQIILKTR